MQKGLLKRIISVLGSFITLMLVSAIKVRSTAECNGVISYKKKVFLKFIDYSANINTFVVARIFMAIGFMTILLVTIYYISLLIFDLMKKHYIIKRMNIFTRIVGYILILSMFILLLAGIDKEYLYGTSIEVTIFGFTWFMAFMFSFVPITAEYLIKK